MHPLGTARLAALPREANAEGEASLFRRGHTRAGKGVCRSRQVCYKDEPATPRRAKSCTPPSDSRTSSPTSMFPEAHLREILNWVHAGDSKREWESQRPARRCSATRAEMHRHSRACSRPDCTFRARAIAGTYRVRQLGGPRPEIDHLPPGVHGAAARVASQPEKLDTRAARVCCQRGASAFF